METAGMLTIPTIVHLMVAKDTPFPQHNKDVSGTAEIFPQLLPRVNARWKAKNFRSAKFCFRLDDIDTVPYILEDFGLTSHAIQENGDEIPLKCGSPPTQPQQEVFRTLQKKFGRVDFPGLQIFVLARTVLSGGDNIGGCGLSKVVDTIGSVWIDQVSLTDEAADRILAHETGHFLDLPHVNSPARLMNRNVGFDLTEQEILDAEKQAGIVMNVTLQ